jgi:hypothetical protein
MEEQAMKSGLTIPPLRLFLFFVAACACWGALIALWVTAMRWLSG